MLKEVKENIDHLAKTNVDSQTLCQNVDIFVDCYQIIEDIKIILDRVMMLNYNLCEYSKKFSSDKEEHVSKMKESRVDIIESQRMGLNHATGRSFSKNKSSNLASMRNKFTLIPTR